MEQAAQPHRGRSPRAQGGPMSDDTFKFRGVFFHPGRKTWRTRIKFQQRSIYMGAYKSPVKAARVYDESARILHGPDAVLNFPDSRDEETRHIAAFRLRKLNYLADDGESSPQYQR